MQNLETEALEGLTRVEGKRGVGDGDIVGAGPAVRFVVEYWTVVVRLVPFWRKTDSDSEPAVSDTL